MTLTEAEVARMREAARPLMEFLSAHCHPHCKAVVDSDSAEIVEVLARTFKTDDDKPTG